MKQIKDLPKDWALYLGDKNMPKWKEALDCYNKLKKVLFSYEGTFNYYTNKDVFDTITKYKKILTPEEFVSYFEIEHTIEDELASMKYNIGDVLINDIGFERKVLGFCGLVYFVSEINKTDIACSTIYTKKELDNFKFKKK